MARVKGAANGAADGAAAADQYDSHRHPPFLT
jgi:hypothetical protein